MMGMRAAGIRWRSEWWSMACLQLGLDEARPSLSGQKRETWSESKDMLSRRLCKSEYVGSHSKVEHSPCKKDARLVAQYLYKPPRGKEDLFSQ